MPWEVEDETITFTGPLGDLMPLIIDPYESDPAVFGTVSPATYATAAAVVLRSLFMEQLADNREAADFVARLRGYVHEDESGLAVETFQILDDIAEHIEPDGLAELLEGEEINRVIAELATSGFEDISAAE
ncbi:MAG: hypothetical protein HY876_05345 [Coriobacteriales bacterium]|nr:hypothetical protein [Coriobacteriales bacterium]